MSRRRRRRRRGRRIGRALGRVGGRLARRAGRAVGRSRLLQTGLNLATGGLGGAVTNLAVSALSNRGSRTPMPVQSTIPFNPPATGGGGSSSNMQVATDILRQARSFGRWLRGRGEIQGLQFLTQFVSSGGSSLPGQLAGLWGQFLADQARSGSPVVTTPLGPTNPTPPATTVPMMPGKGLNPFLMPLTVAPGMRMVATAPPGYVIVTNPFTGEKTGMVKEIARKFGFWKPRPKPPITASEYRKFKTAKRVEAKFEKYGREVGLVKRTNRKRAA